MLDLQAILGMDEKYGWMQALRFHISYAQQLQDAGVAWRVPAIGGASSGLTAVGTPGEGGGVPEGQLTLSAARWSVFLAPEEHLVAHGLASKRNDMGRVQNRHLLLCHAPGTPTPCRLLYVDPKTMEQKGLVWWKPTTVRTEVPAGQRDSFEITGGCRLGLA